MALLLMLGHETFVNRLVPTDAVRCPSIGDDTGIDRAVTHLLLAIRRLIRHGASPLWVGALEYFPGNLPAYLPGYFPGGRLLQPRPVVRPPRPCGHRPQRASLRASGPFPSQRHRHHGPSARGP